MSEHWLTPSVSTPVDPPGLDPLVAQLMEATTTPAEKKALADTLTQGRVASLLEKLDERPEPTLAPVPDEVRGFRVRLDLRGAKPPVWRRMDLPGDLTLPRLHDVIQAAMGWQDCHLHRFRTGKDYRSPYFITQFDLEEEDGLLEDDVRLDQVVTDKGDELWYEYDFGDGWEHRIFVEEVLAEPSPTPTCTAGRLACPPEDCGGIGGYEEIVAWVRSGYDDALLPQGFEDAEHGRAWLPLEWHPDSFDVDEVNEALRSVTAEPVAVVGELADLVGRMERYGDRLLRHVLARPLSHGPTEVSDAEAARLTETYRIFLDIVGDGVDLTAAGYLRPAVVEEIASRTGIADWWIGKANREDLTHPVADIRTTARALGLVSVRKGRLSPTAAVRRCKDDPQALLRHIASRLPIGTKDAERHAGWMALVSIGSGTAAEDWSAEIRDLLHALGWRSGLDGYSPPPSFSETLTVLKLLAGSPRQRWGDLKGSDDAVAAFARSVVRSE